MKKQTNKSKVLLATILPIGIVTIAAIITIPLVIQNSGYKITWTNGYDKYFNGVSTKVSKGKDLELSLSIKDEYTDTCAMPSTISVKIGTTLPTTNYTWTLAADKLSATLKIKSSLINSNIELTIIPTATAYHVALGDSGDKSLWTEPSPTLATVGSTYETQFEVSESGQTIGCPGLPADKKYVTLKIGGTELSSDYFTWTMVEASSTEGRWKKAKFYISSVPSGYLGKMEIFINQPS